jgi:hypothetical protein
VTILIAERDTLAVNFLLLQAQKDRRRSSPMKPSRLVTSGGVRRHTVGGMRKNGTLLRVDYERGLGWIATRYDLGLRVIQQVRGSDEDVHRVAACWAQN